MKKKYDSKCDIWSCGVILFILLTGEPPINGADDQEILNNVEIGQVDWKAKCLKHCSPESIAIMKKMLTYQYNDRPTAADLLDHPWIARHAQAYEVDKEVSDRVLSNLKSFAANQKLMTATISYIVNQLMSQEEIKELKKVFLQLDKNSDGKLSYDEVVEGYSSTYGEAAVCSIVDSIFERLHKSKNEFLTYDDFITATVDRKNLISEQKLEAAFRLFDTNGDGFISPQEIKAVLGKNSKRESEYWRKIVNEVDENGDGEVSLEEFKKLMSKVLDWSKSGKGSLKNDENMPGTNIKIKSRTDSIIEIHNMNEPKSYENDINRINK